MQLDDGQIITLDNDKDYIVVKKITYDATEYVYLITDKKPVEVLVAKSQLVNGNIVLTVVDSKDELDRIINLFEN